jgi:hypothetical protein
MVNHSAHFVPKRSVCSKEQICGGRLLLELIVAPYGWDITGAGFQASDNQYNSVPVKFGTEAAH